MKLSDQNLVHSLRLRIAELERAYDEVEAERQDIRNTMLGMRRDLVRADKRIAELEQGLSAASDMAIKAQMERDEARVWAVGYRDIALTLGGKEAEAMQVNWFTPWERDE